VTQVLELDVMSSGVDGEAEEEQYCQNKKESRDDVFEHYPRPGELNDLRFQWRIRRGLSHFTDRQ
jgi:hypothetical protein